MGIDRETYLEAEREALGALDAKYPQPPHEARVMGLIALASGYIIAILAVSVDRWIGVGVPATAVICGVLGYAYSRHVERRRDLMYAAEMGRLVGPDWREVARTISRR